MSDTSQGNARPRNSRQNAEGRSSRAAPAASERNQDRKPPAETSAGPQQPAGITGAVVNSLWAGASAVSSYVWSFWTPASQGTAPAPLGLQQLSQPHLQSQSHSYSQSLSSSEQVGVVDAAVRPTHRRASTTPPPTPTAADHLETADYGIRIAGRTATGEEAILTQEMISKIHAGLPPRFRLCTNWVLLYGTTEHGFSLSTLFSQSKYHNGPTLTVIRDDGDAVFGVFATEPWKPHFGHYGTGECFLWRVEPDGRIRKYGSTGRNSYFMISETNYIAAGCGEGKFGLWVDAELLNGLSQPVPTFDNVCLASAESFKCVSVEVWGLDLSPLE